MEQKITDPLEKRLASFLEDLERHTTLANKAAWLLETTGSLDAADVKAYFDEKVRLLLSDATLYQELLKWESKDPLSQRTKAVIVHLLEQNQVPKEWLQALSQKEAALGLSYAGFRPLLQGKKVSENEIRNILKEEENVGLRKAAWEASKEIGSLLAPQILDIVSLRNKIARHLGYPDFFQMQLKLQEVDSDWLSSFFEKVAQQSEKAYCAILEDIERQQMDRFAVQKEELGAWCWSEPFCQEDPLDTQKLDKLVEGVDILAAGTHFYDLMGFDVRPILQRSDMFPKEHKNQHAFCMHVDRKGDIRTLNNIDASLKWLETVLHEYGHAIYDQAIDAKLPWILREPPHMITTEAMALLAGRQAYKASSLPLLVGDSSEKKELIVQSDRSLARRQLIFSRWVFVMTAFEKELYRDPSQDLNKLWWSLVEKYQKVKAPKHREGKSDWAAKYHIGLAPVYYFSYLLGEIFASSIQETFFTLNGSSHLANKASGDFLRNRLFTPGNRMSWDKLVSFVTGNPLKTDAWIQEFCREK